MLDFLYHTTAGLAVCQGYVPEKVTEIKHKIPI